MSDAPRDFAAELREMPTSRLLLLHTFSGDLSAFVLGVPARSQSFLVAGPPARSVLDESSAAVSAEIDRRFPVPA